MVIDTNIVTITPEMLSLIAQIDTFKGQWKILSSLTPDRLKALKKVATIESIGSSTRIEGAKLSDKEVEHLLSNLSTHSFRSRDEQEVAGYALACETICTDFDAMPFTENLIKQLHGWLLLYSDKDQRHRGYYKKFPNHVEAFDAQGKSLGTIFETASAFETPLKMEQLILWVQKAFEEKIVHPLLVIGIFIVLFLAIHPFQDGNGRLSRLLTTFLLLKSGYSYVPYCSLETIVEDNKENYYIALRKTQQSLKKKTIDFGPWLTFFLRSLHKQTTILDGKLMHEKLRQTDLSAHTASILQLLESHGKLSISQLEILSSINRNTLKKYLRSMINAALIVRHGKGRATWYTRY